MNSASRLVILFATLGWYGAAAESRPEAQRAFKKYAASVEARIERDRFTPNFLRVASDPATRARLRAGEIPAKSAKSLGIEPSVAIPSGLVEHWVSAAFLPHATIAAAMPQLQDYANRKRFMWPEIIDSRTLSRQGNDFEVYLRVSEKSIISGVLDMNLQITYRMHNHDLAIDSRSEKIVEVAGADAPVGSSSRDRGLLWALNHYWRMAEADGGVYLECEALTLSRRPPAMARWIADPLIAQAARKTVINTVRATMRIMASPENQAE
ncbi:MAG TPA: hypothetical protein VK419_00950 [Bryobacteraceae bacterium]|nr:hypothetical protein [Bryobacteraceae bacterium]